MSVIIFTLLVLCAIANGQKLTIMVPTTSTSTLTCTTTTSTVCLQINGVVTPCRKRRQFWVEEPILLMAPTDDQSQQMLIQPTNTLWVEPTVVPVDWSKGYHLYPGFNGGDGYIYPSIFLPVNDHQTNKKFVADEVYRNGLNQRQAFQTKRTVLYSITKTLTENEMTTKTNTVGISGCTPNPLPFDLC